ncbi:MAG TPA: M28 family peptidase [Gemmatimonadales bacterium]|nr:M28 family peptidase [Gemmatimonadales bacterium]
MIPSSKARTASMALLVATAAGCAGAPLTPMPGAVAYERELMRAAESITPGSVLERIWVIAHDSMGGRDTPSPGLEKTAEYFASKYREWGVQPAGENGSYFQRYPFVRRSINQAASWFEVNENGAISRYPMGTLGYASVARDADVTAPVTLLAGAITDSAIAAAPIEDRIVILVVDAARIADWNRSRSRVNARGPAGVVLLTNQPTESVRAALARMSPERAGWTVDLPSTTPPMLVLHDSVLAGDPMAPNRPDFAAMRLAQTPVVMPAPAEISARIHTEVTVLERTTVPNVLGMIPGSDPNLRNEYVIYSAHMDHVGHRANPRNPSDTIWNGADDDASGSTAVLMMAEAFSRLKVKPRRTMVFLHVSGEEKGLLGSRWYSEHPTLPLERTVADLNFDMVGRNNPDSIVVIGKEHSDLGITLARVNTRHANLGFTTADDIWPEERFYFRSDHFNFARKGVPVLFFFNGVHEDYHQPGDEVEKIDTDKIARVAKIGFYLGAEIANTTDRPKWNPESYDEIVEK